VLHDTSLVIRAMSPFRLLVSVGPSMSLIMNVQAEIINGKNGFRRQQPTARLATQVS